MGRPRSPNKCVVVGMRLTPAFVILVDLMAKERGLSRYVMARDLITKGYEFEAGRARAPEVIALQAELDNTRRFNLSLSKDKIDLQDQLDEARSQIGVLTARLVGAGLERSQE